MYLFFCNKNDILDIVSYWKFSLQQALLNVYLNVLLCMCMCVCVCVTHTHTVTHTHAVWSSWSPLGSAEAVQETTSNWNSHQMEPLAARLRQLRIPESLTYSCREMSGFFKSYRLNVPIHSTVWRKEGLPKQNPRPGWELKPQRSYQLRQPRTRAQLTQSRITMPRAFISQSNTEGELSNSVSALNFYWAYCIVFATFRCLIRVYHNNRGIRGQS